MAEVSIKIPQIGEGLQEARLVATLKQPGDKVKRDEPIYQMETDKAVMDVESPYEGTLVKWVASVDEILAIGADVAIIETSDKVQEEASDPDRPAESARVAATTTSATAGGSRRRDMPPRTRAYAKEKGLSDQDLAKIPETGKKIMPEDVDAFLAGAGGEGYSEQQMSAAQRLLSSRLVRGSQLAVPGTETIVSDWSHIEKLRAEIKESGDEFSPSSFTMFAFAVAQVMGKHPYFRSTIVGDSTIRTYDHANLGIAVALEGDQLVIAKIEDADTLGWRDFADRMRERIDHARAGNDQADASIPLTITNMQSFGLRDAVAVVVPPSVATLFLGEAYNGLDQTVSKLKLQRCANIGLTFDHRLINGVGAAQLLTDVRSNVENIRDLLGG
ncbi:MAG: 2-oxo acid dehydrogenase subunit E2 [Armatimonadetes bacterium]|nr:2-oxo acid dehydrogenase subunit E2 [Armatimonadota bacterium]